MIYNTYIAATVLFPERFSRKYIAKNEPNSIAGDTVSFNISNYLIDAKILYNIPYELSNLPEIQKEIVKPTIELVKSDIKPAEGLLEKLRDFAKENQHHNQIFYEREPSGNRFKVYDYSKGCNTFEELLRLKELPIKLLKSKYRNLCGMAGPIGQEKGKIAYVSGSDLRTTMERALKIYNISKEIKEISLMLQK